MNENKVIETLTNTVNYLMEQNKILQKELIKAKRQAFWKAILNNN